MQNRGHPRRRSVARVHAQAHGFYCGFVYVRAILFDDRRPAPLAGRQAAHAQAVKATYALGACVRRRAVVPECPTIVLRRSARQSARRRRSRYIMVSEGNFCRIRFGPDTEESANSLRSTVSLRCSIVLPYCREGFIASLGRLSLLTD